MSLAAVSNAVGLLPFVISPMGLRKKGGGREEAFSLSADRRRREIESNQKGHVK